MILSSICLEMDNEMASSFAGFPTCFAQNSALAGSVILDCILSLDSGFIVDNSALHIPFCDLSTLLQSNLKVTRMLHLLAKEIHTQGRNFVRDSRLTHVLQRFVSTNFLLKMALLDKQKKNAPQIPNFTSLSAELI